MADYHFVTVWHITAPREKVWEVLNDFRRYGEWWPCFVEHHDRTPGERGVGARVERVVRGRLPYSLRYTTTVTKQEAPKELAYDAAGDLIGAGRFLLEEQDGGTRVIFHWDVQTSGRWMNLLAPLLRPLFAWNHNWVMTQGEAGLKQRLAGQ